MRGGAAPGHWGRGCSRALGEGLLQGIGGGAAPGHWGRGCSRALGEGLLQGIGGGVAPGHWGRGCSRALGEGLLQPERLVNVHAHIQSPLWAVFQCRHYHKATIHLHIQDMEFCSKIVRVIIAGNVVTNRPTKAATVKDTKVRNMSCVCHTHTHSLTHIIQIRTIYIYMCTHSCFIYLIHFYRLSISPKTILLTLLML